MSTSTPISPIVRTLFIAPQWIGDAVMTEPVLRRLQQQGQRITVAALPWVAPIYRAMPQVAAVLELPFSHGGLQWHARRALARELRGQFEVAYVCPNSLKSALLPWWAGIGKRIGYIGEWRYGLLTHHLPNPPRTERPPMVDFYNALADVAVPNPALAARPDARVDVQEGAASAASDAPQLALDPTQASDTLLTLGLSAQGYYVLCPGAEYGAAKRWPATHYAALAQQLDLPVVLLGSAKEAQLCADIAALADAGLATDATLSIDAPTHSTASARFAAGTNHCTNHCTNHRTNHCINLAGRTTLDEALVVLAHAKAVVSNDSGLMHVAAAFGVPQVALFGSSSPRHTPPLSRHAQVIWLKDDSSYLPPLDCAPCFERVCPLGHTRCLVDIAPTKVQQAVAQVLAI